MPLHHLYIDGDGTITLWDTRKLALATRHPVAVALWTTLPLLIGAAIIVYGVGTVGDPSMPSSTDHAVSTIRFGTVVLGITAALCVGASQILGFIERRSVPKSFIAEIELPGIHADDLAVLMYDDILSIPAREALAHLADETGAGQVRELLVNAAMNKPMNDQGQTSSRAALSGWYRGHVSPA